LHLKVINGMLHIVFQSGESTSCHLLTLPAAKKLGRGISRLVEEIEKKTGQVFDDRLPDEPMISPWTSGGEKGT
jgi:hypothetical protein